MDQKRPSKAPPPQVQNSIRMDAGRLKEFIDELDRRGAMKGGDPRRSHVRWPFRQVAITMRIMHAAGSYATVNVACRNISTGGMSILHSSFMHTGTKVVMTLPVVGGQNLDLEGTIVRCSHVQGTCHELGIRFKTTIDPRNFLQIDPFEDGFSVEKVSPESLVGTVVYIEDSTLDQSLIRHFLRETQIRLRIAGNPAEAEAIIKEGCDLILCDYMIGSEDGARYVTRLRSTGCSIPVIMITADTSDATRQKLIRAEADAFLSKPVTMNLLHRALAEFLSGESGMGLKVSSLAANHPNSPMVENFVREMHQLGDQIENAIKDQSVERCRNLALQVAGVSPVMGFTKLAQLAQLAEKSVSSSMSTEESDSQLRRLMNACRDVRTRPAA